MVSGFVGDMPTLYSVRISYSDLIHRIKRRVKHLTHKLCDIFGRYPCRSEPDADVRSSKRLRHHAFQHPHINRKRRVFLCALLCRFQLFSDVAGQVFVRRLPLTAYRLAEDLAVQCGNDLFLRHTAQQGGHVMKVDMSPLREG